MQPQKMIAYMSRLVNAHHRFVARELSDHGIGSGQYPILLHVQVNPGIRQDALTEQMLLNKSTVARAAAQLEQSGYLDRSVPPADKRVYLLSLTARGEAILPFVRATVQSSLDRLTKGLSEAQKEDCLSALHFMAANNVTPIR